MIIMMTLYFACFQYYSYYCNNYNLLTATIHHVIDIYYLQISNKRLGYVRVLFGGNIGYW